MGNREELLASAKRLLHEKGYARVTARDVASDAGVSLAAIGYHFRSTRALLNEAMMAAMQDWADQLERSLSGIELSVEPLERFEQVWAAIIAGFSDDRALWATQFDAMTQLDHVPEIREFFVAGLREGREGLAHLIAGIDPAAEPERARTVGSFYAALLSGLLVHARADPDHAPSARDLAVALRDISAGIAGPP